MTEQLLDYPSTPITPLSELNRDDILEFEPDDGWPPYPPGHPARQYLNELHSVPLDYSEEQALARYAETRFSSDLNDSIAAGHPVHEVKLIDSVMDKTRLPKTTVVFRGHLPDKTRVEDVAPGSRFQRAGYTSSTLDSSLARGWRNSLTVLRIEVPPGTPVAVPSLDEAEILLPHGSVFEVTGAEDRGDYTEVHVVLVPPEKQVSGAEPHL
jgi:hypothetical protein